MEVVATTNSPFIKIITVPSLAHKNSIL